MSTFFSGHHRRYAPSCASPPSSSQLVGGVQKATRLAGACVALIAGEHEVNVNLVFKWRRDHWEGQLGPVAPPVVLLPVSLSQAPTPSAEEAMQLPLRPGGLVVECDWVALRQAQEKI